MKNISEAKIARSIKVLHENGVSKERAIKEWITIVNNAKNAMSVSAALLSFGGCEECADCVYVRVSLDDYAELAEELFIDPSDRYGKINDILDELVAHILR